MTEVPASLFPLRKPLRSQTEACYQPIPLKSVDRVLRLVLEIVEEVAMIEDLDNEMTGAYARVIRIMSRNRRRLSRRWFLGEDRLVVGVGDGGGSMLCINNTHFGSLVLCRSSTFVIIDRFSE